MNKIFWVALSLSLLVGVLLAESMIPTDNKTPVYLSGQSKALPVTRVVPDYTFTVPPTAIMTSYYDYMIGSYNGFPLRTIPASAGGGYLMTYHGKRQPTSTRRAFYAYLMSAGNIINMNEITYFQNNEGYPTLAFDPASGKPLYAWHCNADTDAEYEVQFVADVFPSGIAGLFNDVQIAIDSPITINTIHGQTTDNEFIWPVAQIGPSPFTEKRRIYLATRNSVTNGDGPSENLYLAYADFDGDMIELATPLTWNFVTIPEMNDWNNDPVIWRRPFYSLTTDDAGNVYYAGYHFAQDTNNNSIPEPDMDVFKCDNYGMGTWTRVSSFSNIPTWNPADYFADESDVPYPDDALSWAIDNSSHLNAVVDNLGRVHVPAVWALNTNDGSYYPELQFMKEFVFDPADNQFAINEIYPAKDSTDTVNLVFTPWDMEAPWGEVDEMGGTASDTYPLMATDWPFPHWNTSAHTDAMLYHYNNVKLSEVNDQDMMVAVWQNAWRARQDNVFMDSSYYAWREVPEIYIAVSPNNGETWSQPIVLNNIETPALYGITPMWVYPADKVIFAGMQGDNKVGKLGLMFYDDYTWGANAITPAYHPTNNGGRVMFMELQIVFPNSGVSQTVALPSFSPPSGPYDQVMNVAISCSTPGAVIRYTTNGSAPHGASPIYSEPIQISSTTTLKARAYRNGWMPSSTASATYTLPPKVVFPIFSPPGGLYATAQNVSISCSTPESSIHYTTDESDPTESSPVYSEPINISSTTTLKARAYRNGWIPSIIASASYTIRSMVESPTFSPDGGSYTDVQHVAIDCATDGATIYYTTNGAFPTEYSFQYSGPITISSNTTLKAKAYKTGWTSSPIASAEYAINYASSIQDGFENYEDFAVSFAPWITQDLDGSTTYGYSDSQWPNLGAAQSFIVFNPSATVPPLTDSGFNPHSGDRLLACFSATSTVNDDWLISPRLYGIDLLRFWARSHSSTSGLERFRIGYSTTDSSPGSFTIISGEPYVEAPVEWNEFNYAIPQVGPVYLGIQCVSSSATCLMIDDVLAVNSSDADDSHIYPVDDKFVTCYPNPFKSSVNLRFYASTPAETSLEIYNIAGRKVRTISFNQAIFGSIECTWDGKDQSGHELASGAYLVKVKHGDNQYFKRVILMK